MKKVLMISYHFPPIAGVGVFRTLKFVKYLSDFGWQPVILSVKKSKYAPFDRTLLNQISRTMNVYRTNTLESKIYRWGPSFIGINPKWYQIPDAFLGWLPFALKKAKEVVKKEKPDAIFSTSPPVTSHLIAMLLKKKTGLPWVADFRDPWTQNFSSSYPTRIHKNIDEHLERKVAKYADRIILITEPYRKDFLRKYPDIDPEKCVTITNGYDPDDFTNMKAKKSNKFTITHVGSFYGIQSPTFFLDALQSAIMERKSLNTDAEVLFVGKSSKEYTGIANRYGLEDIIQEIGYISHNKAIQYMIDSTCLLLVIGLGKNSKNVFTGKIFEYIASKTPIIATVPIDGVASALVKETNAGVIIDTNDVDGIKKAILHYYDMWKNNNLQIKPKLDITKKYNRIVLTKTLVENLDEISIK